MTTILNKFLTILSGTGTVLGQGNTTASLVHVPPAPTLTNPDGTPQIATDQQPQTRSLWEEAWKKLPEDVRNYFQFTLDETDNKGSGAANQLLKVVTEVRDMCGKGKLIDTRNDGKRSRRAIVRDLADRLINWVSKFVAVGDTLMQYDAGHAAIPWAIVRFILQVCKFSYIRLYKF